MDSKEATSSPASGASPVNSSSYSNVEIETVPEVNDSGLDKKPDNSNSNIISNSSFDDVSDDGGYVSGQEEFEAEMKTLEKPILVENSGQLVDGSLEPKGGEVPGVSAANAIDDGEIKEIEGSEGEKVGEGDETLLEKVSGGSSSPVTGNGLTGSVDVDASETKAAGGEGEEGGVEGLALDEIKDIDLHPVDGEKESRLQMADGAANNLGSSSGGDEVIINDESPEILNTLTQESALAVEDKGKEAESCNTVEPFNGKTPPGASGVKEVNEAVEDSVLPAADASQINGAAELKLVEVDGMEFTSEGDSVVEAIDVSLSGPGIAVVGMTEESKTAGGNLEEATDDERCNDNATVEASPNVHEKAEKMITQADNQSPGSAVGYDNVVGAAEPVGLSTEAEGADNDEKLIHKYAEIDNVVGEVLENGEMIETRERDVSESSTLESALVSGTQKDAELQYETQNQVDEGGDDDDVSGSDEDTDGMIFGNSEAAKNFIEELEQGDGSHSGGESSHDNSHRMDGQIVTDSDEEADTDDEGDGKELFDSAALAALLKAATGADSEGGNITITSQDGSRLFTVERPAGLGSSLRSLRPTPRPNRSNLFGGTASNSGDTETNLSEEEKTKLEKLQQIRVKFLRLVQRLGLSSDESMAGQVLYRLALIAGRQSSQIFSLDAAKATALEIEAEGKDDLDLSLNILVIGKSGVGKSATINSIFGEEKAQINAFRPATSSVKEITGIIDGVKVRVFDTPGLKSNLMEQTFNRSILSSVKKLTTKNPPDIVLYVDRLDAQSRDLNDLPLLRSITTSLGPSIWRSAIVTLTHAASAPPDGPSGSTLSYEVFVTQRSHVVQQSISQAVGDLRMMSPSLMNPVSLVENHPACRKNREGQKVLPNGQSWRPQLLLLCYSMKILSEASSLSKPQDPFDHRRLFGFRARSPPLPYMLSSMLQSRPHPKLSSDQGGELGDSDVDLDDFSDADAEEEDEYDQLPPFKPLSKPKLAQLSKEQRRAYFEEYDYRVKLLQKKQWKEELKRMREMKKNGNSGTTDDVYQEDDADSAAAAPVAVPLPDMVLPLSFDGENPTYRYRFIEPTSQFIARPVLDTHGWDHDCGYDGVNIEQNLAIASQFPAAVTVQVTKDKKDFSINLDSAIAAKHGENGSSMAGFDIQTIGKQLAYIFRGETKFKISKNKAAGGISVTLLGENVVTGAKIEDQVSLGKQFLLVGSAGLVRSQQDTAYGANFELQRREQDYPIGQVQSTFSMSIIKWRGDLALGFNSLAQFSVGRNSKVAVRAGINNKLSGQITVRTSSSEHLSIALAAVVPTAMALYKKLWPSVGEKYSIY